MKIKLTILFLCIITAQNLHFGDYCEGMAQGLLLTFLVLVFGIYLIILYIRETYLFFKQQRKVDFKLLILTLTTIILNLFISSAYENYFWVKVKFKGNLDDIDNKSWITLLENKKYLATISSIEERCTFQGEYMQKGDTILLKDTTLKSKTFNTFTNKYILEKNKILIPLDTNYKKIKS